MIKYSIIIPTYNRDKNLSCSLMALVKQTFPIENWEVIIADESNIPISSLAKRYSEFLNIRYFWRKNETYNPGPIKNIGSRIASGEALIFVDADVILNDKALESYDKIHTKYPESIILGRYDLLMPQDIKEERVANDFDKVVSNQFPIPVNWAPGPIPGTDPRWKDEKTQYKTEPAGDFALALFGGNTLIPKKLFDVSGGFDPNITGHGGEDCCLGRTLEKIGAKAVFSDKVIGWHIWHPRNQEANEKSVRKNIDYMHRKFKLFEYAEKNEENNG